MSQEIFDDIDPSVTSGDDLADILNDFKDAIASGFIGVVRPPNLQAGGIWIDSSLAGTPDFLWKVKIWDGTNEITLLTVNIQTNALILTDTNDLFQVTKISADTAGAIIAMAKNRIATNGQVLDGDVLGELQFRAKNNDGDIIIPGKLKAVASDNYTDAAAGCYLVWEATADGQATLTEMMRLKDGNLGVGDTAPEKRVSVKGATDSVGVKVDRVSDDADGSKSLVIKRRITGVGQVQSGDSVDLTTWQTADETGALQAVAALQVITTAIQTAASHLAEWKLSTSDGGALTEKIVVGTIVWIKKGAKFDAIEFVQADIATTATIAALSTVNSVVRMTGSTATSIQGIDATGKAKRTTIINVSTAIVSVENQNGTASANNRVINPHGAKFPIPPGGTATYEYDATTLRWRLVASTGCTVWVRNTDQSIASSGVIAVQGYEREVIYVQGNGGAQTANATTPLAAGSFEGQEVDVVGLSNTNKLTILHGGNVDQNGDVVLGLNQRIRYSYDLLNTKWLEVLRRE